MNQNPKAFSRSATLLNMFADRGVRGTQGSLRLEALLANSALYTFQVNDNQNKLVTEIRLRQGDAFIPTKIGMYIKKAGTSTSPTDAEQTVSILRTYPNSTIFTAASEAANLAALYNSRLITTVNSVNLTEFIDTTQFLRVGVAQQGLVVSQLATPVTPAAYLRDEWTGPDYGMIPFQQDLCFNGLDNQTLTLQLPAAVNCAGTSSNNYAVIIFRGVMLPNGAKVAQDKSIRSFLKQGVEMSR